MPCSTDDDHLDKGYAWVIVFAVFAIHVVYDGINYSCGIFLQGRNTCTTTKRVVSEDKVDHLMK